MKTLTLALIAVALAGCGKTGELERPGPMFGGPAPAETSDTTTDPGPPRTLPIDGGPSDPGASPPQGALPDPNANPQ